jgi:hypothetical protein
MTKLNNILKHLAPSAAICLLCACVGCGGSTPSGCESPQAAFDASQAAYQARDWGTVYDAHTAESQQEFAVLPLANYVLQK